jgi:hypothetical protein
MADTRPALAPYTTAYALPATLRGSLAVTVIWDAYRPVAEASADVVTYDTDWASFRVDEVGDIDAGDTFTAPRVLGAMVRTYRVERVDRSDPEFLHVVTKTR